MYVRLAFSVASHLEPDILLIDEVLAVGDQEFKRKCLNKLLDVSGQGRTIIMVSHQMAYLKSLCQRGVYLNAGKIMHDGAIDEVIDRYVTEVENINTIPLSKRLDRKGTGHVKVMSMEWRDDKGAKIPSVMSGQSVNLRLYLIADHTSASNVEVRVDFYDAYGQLWCMCKNSISGQAIDRMEGAISMECHFPKFPLNKNFYYLTTAVYVQNELSDEVVNAGAIEVEKGMFYTTGKLPPPTRGVLIEYSWKQIEG
jgi:lipopolysaccharide transport system ATP-binding protein